MRMINTKPIIDSVQVTPLSLPKYGEIALWIAMITHETAVYKPFIMLLIN